MTVTVPQGATPGRAAYLDVKYSCAAVPYTGYPRALAHWLRDHVYGDVGRLLDLGCGRGEHLAVFAATGFDVAGVDASPRAPELARGFDVRVADLERDPLPFPRGSFDFVYSKSVVEHLRDPVALLARACEALRPGGVAAVMTPSWAHTYWGPFYIDPTHVTPFTAPSLTTAFEMAGFTDVTVSHFYQLPAVWRVPALRLFARLVARLPLPYRPYQRAPWPARLNTLIRFSKEVMLLGVGRRPADALTTRGVGEPGCGSDVPVGMGPCA